MSTQLDTRETTTDTEIKDDRFTLASLVAALEATASDPSLAQIYEWLEKSDISRDEMEPYTAFKEGNYFRHRVFRNQHVEMLVLCWRPGQRTPIHDHNGSHGGVKVWQGVLWETTFQFDAARGLEYKAARDLGTGSVTGSDVPDIHQLGNPDVSGQDLITVHIYAPPLGVLHTYKPGSQKIDLYIPDETDQLN